MTTVGWIDVFTRKEQKMIIVNSLLHCQKEKGLTILGWCLMPSHLHMICRADGIDTLSDILRDFKKFTSKRIVEEVNNGNESRREWMLELFSKACAHLKREQEYKVWQDGNQSKEIFTNSFFYEKLNYIHINPVEDKIIEKPQEYLFSSARNYAGRDYLLDIVLESQNQINYF